MTPHLSRRQFRTATGLTVDGIAVAEGSLRRQLDLQRNGLNGRVSGTSDHLEWRVPRLPSHPGQPK
jgi:hypothetical protein